MSDARALVGAYLGIESVYASDDAGEVRCVVELHSRGAPKLHDWCVRVLRPEEVGDESASCRSMYGRNGESQSDVGGLERQLDAILFSGRPFRRDNDPEHVVDDPSRRRHVLDELYADIPRWSIDEHSKLDITNGLAARKAKPRHVSLASLRGVVSLDDDVELVVFDYEPQTLQTLLKFNRFLLDNEDSPDAALSDMKRRFLAYQLCEVVSFVRSRGLTYAGQLSPSRIWVADGTWIRMGIIPCVVGQTAPTRVAESVERVTQATPTERWCRGDLSNFEYLLILNAAAGRRMADSVFHPVLPWVTDFSAPHSGWRDLTRSKFRLMKGDNQLDRTFESSAIPHHIPESLSEITYYIYMARRTPMAVLRRVVRNNFQPKEYPQTLQRMYHWTPDECIPEFFTDSSVFASIHGTDTMPDLELPTWANEPTHLIRIHRQMLESPEVSSSLHNWIDLNFGVSLSGEDAIRNKNVPLRVSRKSPGFVQVFEAPHPKKDTGHRNEVAPTTRDMDCGSRGLTNGFTRDISASLSSAIKIADEALNEMTPQEYTPGVRHGLPSPTAAERRGLSSSFVKLKKKQKHRAKSHGSGEIVPPLSPGTGQGPSRSPTVGRFAHAIPRFFGSESSSAATTPDASAINISDFNTTATNQGALSSSLGPSYPTQEARRSPSAYHGIGGAGHVLPPGLLHMTGSNQPSSGTHIFRDLWHQLSKQDDDELIDTTDGSSSFIDLDWSEAEYDSLDDLSVQLLRAGASIALPEEETTLLQSPCCDTAVNDQDCNALDVAYSLPEHSCTASRDRPTLPKHNLVDSHDLFPLGCIVAEMYTGNHIFTRSSVRRYEQSFRDSGSSDWEIPAPIGNQLRLIPMNLKSLVVGFIHPSPPHRLSALQTYLDANAWRWNNRLSGSPFPSEMGILFRFVGDAHAEEDSNNQLRVVQKHLPLLVRLPDSLLQVSLPIILTSFRVSSQSDPTCAAQACAAIVFCLPDVARRLGSLDARRELFEDILSVYEQPALPPVLRLALSSPEVVKTIVQTFGIATVIRHFVPIMVDWLTSPVYSDRRDGDGRSLQLFSGELTSMISITLAELGSSDVVGPSIAVKYVLPLLLPHLGKISSKWLRMIDKRSLIRQDSRTKSPTVGSIAAYGGKNGDGVHVAYAPKQVLYENHQIADSILLVCRELPQSVLSEFVLPHLLDVIPRLVDVAESVSSAQIEGVPDDLAREVYVTLRVFRHVIRTLSEVAIQREILQRRSTVLIDVLNSIQPPFLHPRTIDAVLASISDNTKPSSNSRYNSTRLKQIRDRLSTFRGERAQDLRAFTAVGVARTITSILQKSGAAAAVGAGGVLQSINAFLVRCAAIYSELEVSNFQWKMASEVVSEMCSPLRTLLGSAGFARHFPSVQSSSVLQMLLLPTNSAPPSSGLRDTSHRSILRQTSSVVDDDTPADDYEAPTNIDAVQRIAASSTELMQTMYRQARLNGIKTTSFLHVSMRSGSAWTHDLNEEVFLIQEERKRRRAALTSNRAGGETAWLRPRVKAPYSPRYEESNTEDNFSSCESPLGSSWCLRGEVRHSVRAHSSVTRSVAVDLNEEFVVTASKNGSCRTWRLASYPGQSTGTVQIDTPNLMSARMLEDSHRGMALTATAVHVWDIRTSQVLFKVPFADDAVTSCMLPRVLPYRHYLDFSPTSRGCTSAESAVMQGVSDIIVSTSRKLHLIDARSSPRVVADWRVDAHDAVWITASAVITTPANPVGLLAVGTASGQVMLLDKRMGLRVASWQALESHIAMIVQYAPSYVLIVGIDREARVWRIDNEHNPALCMIITNIPEGVRDTQVSVQAYSDMAIMYVASSAKLFCTRLIHDASPEAKSPDIITVRLESWSLMDNFYGNTSSTPAGAASTVVSTANSPDRSRLHRTKIAVQSIAVLPLRQVILLGGEDGTLRTCV